MNYRNCHDKEKYLSVKWNEPLFVDCPVCYLYAGKAQNQLL